MSASTSNPLPLVSWQSNVLLGTLGNKVARSVYDFLKIPVTCLDTVLFSGSASRSSFGLTFDSTEWLDFFRQAFTLLGQEEKCQILHTGFFGSPKQMQLLCELFQERVIHPQLFLLDPVMGDNGKMYVSSQVAQSYPKLLSHCQVITPNLFELEQLCQESISTFDQVLEASNGLLLRYPNLQAIVVTSVPSPSHQVSLSFLERNKKVQKLSIPRSSGPHLGGTGDLFSSLLCSHYAQGTSLSQSVKRAFAQTVSVVRYSHSQGSTLCLHDSLPKTLLLNQDNAQNDP